MVKVQEDLGSTPSCYPGPDPTFKNQSRVTLDLCYAKKRRIQVKNFGVAESSVILCLKCLN